jgi:hypothetical protein
MSKAQTFIENKERFKTSDISARKSPHALAIIWNFKYRMGSTSAESEDAFNNLMEIQKKLILTKSIVEIQTEKSKIKGEGAFSIVLAPTKNWCSELTLGSWICIMMTPSEKITRADLDKANPKLVKFIGVVESVTCNVSVGDNGQKRTLYKIMGSDWSMGFRDIVYMDPGWKTYTTEQNQMSQALFLKTKKLNGGLSMADYTTKRNLMLVNSIWLNTPIFDDKDAKTSEEDKNRDDALQRVIRNNILPSMVNTFSVPKEVLEFMGYDISKDEGPFFELAKYIKYNTGKIDSTGEYDNQIGWPYSIIKLWNPEIIFGNYSVWQMLQSVNAEHIEEMFNDLIFYRSPKENNTPSDSPFGMPLKITEENVGDFISKTSSNFKNPSFGGSSKFSMNNISIGGGAMRDFSKITDTNEDIEGCRFSIFNRIMPFYIRNPEKAKRYQRYDRDLELQTKEILKRVGGNYKFNLPDPATLLPLSLSHLNPLPQLSGFGSESKDAPPPSFNKEVLTTLVSMYCDVPKVRIPLNDIMGISYSTSSANRINIVELHIHESILSQSWFKGLANVLKWQTQEWENVNIFARDGLKLKQFKITHYIVSDKILQQAITYVPPKEEKKEVKKSLNPKFKAKQEEEKFKKFLDDEINKLSNPLSSSKELDINKINLTNQVGGIGPAPKK